MPISSSISSSHSISTGSTSAETTASTSLPQGVSTTTTGPIHSSLITATINAGGSTQSPLITTKANTLKQVTEDVVVVNIFPDGSKKGKNPKGKKGQSTTASIGPIQSSITTAIINAGGSTQSPKITTKAKT